MLPELQQFRFVLYVEDPQQANRPPLSENGNLIKFLNLQKVLSTYLAGYSPQHFISGAVVFPEPLPPVPGRRVVVVAGASVVIEGHSEAKSD